MLLTCTTRGESIAAGCLSTASAVAWADGAAAEAASLGRAEHAPSDNATRQMERGLMIIAAAI